MVLVTISVLRANRIVHKSRKLLLFNIRKSRGEKFILGRVPSILSLSCSLSLSFSLSSAETSLVAHSLSPLIQFHVAMCLCGFIQCRHFSVHGNGMSRHNEWRTENRGKSFVRCYFDCNITPHISSLKTIQMFILFVAESIKTEIRKHFFRSISIFISSSLSLYS